MKDNLVTGLLAVAIAACGLALATTTSLLKADSTMPVDLKMVGWFGIAASVVMAGVCSMQSFRASRAIG